MQALQPSTVSRRLEALGSGSRGFVAEMGRFTLFLFGSIGAFFRGRHRLRKLSTALHEIGVRCTPLILCVGLFTGMVLGLQGYYTLVRFGSESLLGPAVALTLIRELGPVLTALMVVGEAGSALAAELGHERQSEQVDALVTMQIEPRGFLIGPRLLAALIAFPILTAFFDLVGIYGGYLTGVVLLHVDSGIYWSKLKEGVEMIDIRGGFVKSVVFGLLTTSVCAFYGFYTHLRSRLPGTQGVSQTTTRAVVISSVIVLVTDYVITCFYV